MQARYGGRPWPGRCLKTNTASAMIAVQDNDSLPEVLNFTPRPDKVDDANLFSAEDADKFAPTFAQSLDDLAVSATFLSDLALKALSLEPVTTSASVAQRLHLGIVVTDTLLQRLARDKIIETKGVAGMHNHRYGM